jgi:hypothetical protein
MPHVYLSSVLDLALGSLTGVANVLVARRRYDDRTAAASGRVTTCPA